MYNLQATLREITVEVMTIQEITVEVVDLPLYLDMSDFEVDSEANTTTDFPDLSPAQLGLHVTHL